MSAAQFFADAASDMHGNQESMRFSLEDELETEAREIDEKIAPLQGYIRGFLHRSRPARSNILNIDARITDRTYIGSAPAPEHSSGGEARTNVDDDSDTNDPLIVPAGDLAVPTSEQLEHNLRLAATENRHGSDAHAAPWWIDNPVLDASRNLCNICARINFDVLLHRTAPDMYEPPIPLGNLHIISRNSQCTFCRLVTHTASTLLGTTVEKLKDADAGNGIDCHLCGDPDWDRFATRIRQISLSLTMPVLTKHQNTRPIGRVQQVLEHTKPPPEQKFNDVRLVLDQINLDLLKSWVRVCERDHTSTLLVSNTYMPSFTPEEPTDIHNPSTLAMESCQPKRLDAAGFNLTVIDVRKGCLIDVPPDSRYIALSYVWGGPQAFQNVLKIKDGLYLPHSISLHYDTIPYTIHDAMLLVALLDEQYLWVDSLCICQDDMENKMEQIRSMGDIYSQAVFTIVAAYGASANAGLPGVRPASRRSVQHRELVQNMLLVNELPHLDEILSSSHWNTRGWTYQENELSNRYLIFGENQVYYRCNRKVLKEDSGLRDVAYALGRTLRLRGENHPIWNSYRRAVEAFTQRSLSFESDVINAFQGVASLLQRGFKSDFLFGLPETELDIAILWQPCSPVRRRVDEKTGIPHFPSWSWAGWAGDIKYRWSKHLLDDLCRVEWQYTNPDIGRTGFCSSDELRASEHGMNSEWRYVSPRRKGTPYYYQPREPDIWCLHPVAAKEERHRRVLIQPSSHTLSFKASVAMFHISVVHNDPGLDPVAICESNAHILCPFSILDTEGFAAGTIYLPGHEIAGILPDQKYEIVCLSRRRSDVYPNSSGDDVPEPTYPSPEDDWKAPETASAGRLSCNEKCMSGGVDADLAVECGGESDLDSMKEPRVVLNEIEVAQDQAWIISCI